MTWDLDVDGTGPLDQAAVRALAPEALASFDRMVAAVAAVPHAEIVELTRRRIGQVHGAEADADEVSVATDPTTEPADEKVRSLATWSISPLFTTAERACLGFAEQFVVDVGAIDDEQREELKAALGPDVFEYVQALYVLDHGVRLVAAVRQVFGVELTPVPSSEPGDMWPGIDAFLTEVGRLSRLDPLLTELIRLRGARAHACRLCRSRRSLSAVSTEGGEQAIDALDDYESSDLPERQKVALRLTDAIVWQPASFPAELLDQVRAQFSPEEALEIVLDVVRNASNKSAVALGVDQANVTEGVEYFDLQPDGSLVYGLSR
ncbi:MAG: carboxymuconolactone decarboxylase family protein [Acidimicrobiales bacterium]